MHYVAYVVRVKLFGQKQKLFSSFTNFISPFPHTCTFWQEMLDIDLGTYLPRGRKYVVHRFFYELYPRIIR